MRMEMRVAGAIAAAAAAIAVVAPRPADASAAARGNVDLDAISTRPAMVTGGDVLVELRVRGTDPETVRIRRNGADVTSAFAARPGRPHRLTGLVDGLRRGPNLITAFGPRVRRPARLSVHNSPSTGPLFSGRQQEPFVCRTEEGGLGPAIDPDCSAPSRVDWYYRTAVGTFAPLADPRAPLPADGVRTTTRDGRTVDYVVRLESGVIDRSIYRFAVLAPGGVPADGWNRRFVFGFGGGCGAGYQQGVRGPASALADAELSKGYATLTGSLNVLNTACNDVLSAEAALMLKEHAIEELGAAPVWTMGQGGSGGSIQQQLIAQNYPGILDGLMPGASFPDGSAPDYPDCRLINAYLASPKGAALDPGQRRAITGLADPNGCLALGNGADVINAGEGCDESVVPPAWIFDPATNPAGIRCSVWDSLVNIYGIDPDTGLARRTLDNVGVQYGLAALNDGAIDVGEFLDLNEGIGGYDDDGELRAERAVADPKALAIAYRSGRINRAAGGYGAVPVLDIRNYVDDQVNVHQYVNTYRMRARIDAARGDHANHVMWRAGGGSSTRAMQAAALATLADWMDAIAADGSDRPAAAKVEANRPADAVDACWIGGVRHDGVARIGAANLCEQTFPPHSLPANVAGRPLDSMILKCSLKPVDADDYEVAFTPAQWQRLRAIFPEGVCDWTRPGVEERALAGTWQRFGPDPDDARRKRRIAISLRRAGRGRVAVRASMRPCPQVSWQRIVLEGRARGAPWRRIASGYASGPRCRVRATVGRRRGGHHRIVRIRARSAAVGGFRAARSRAARP